MTQEQRGSGSAAVSVSRGTPVEPARLAITVTDDKGPIADATVRLAPRTGEIVVVRTGRDGVAHADQLEPGAWTVSAPAADHVPAALPARQIAAGADDKLAIKLASGGRTLSGMVSDATGGPIAGARIDAARVNRVADPSDAVSTTLTGADGKYRLTVAGASCWSRRSARTTHHSRATSRSVPRAPWRTSRWCRAARSKASYATNVRRNRWRVRACSRGATARRCCSRRPASAR